HPESMASTISGRMPDDIAGTPRGNPQGDVTAQDRTSSSLVSPQKEGQTTTMDARLDYFSNATAAKFIKYINSAGKVITESSLPAATQELVKIRASQINGCS